MNTTPEQWKAHLDRIFGPEREWELAEDFTDKGWNEAATDFIAAKYPEAVKRGMGYWKIPRKLEILYSVGKVYTRPMGRRD